MTYTLLRKKRAIVSPVSLLKVEKKVEIPHYPSHLDVSVYQYRVHIFCGKNQWIRFSLSFVENCRATPMCLT